MGNHRSISNMDVTQPLSDAWQHAEDLGYCDILVNRNTGEQAEHQIITLTNQPEFEFERYEYRHLQDQNLVRVLSVRGYQPQVICAGQDPLQVITERIPYRLAEAHNMPLAESLYVLHQALIGFMAIHQFEKYVPVTEDLIGFTPQGRTRVWLNPNFAKNYPVQVDRQLLKLDDEHAARKMISELFQVVEQHTIGRSFPSSFKASWNPSNFVEAINTIRGYTTERGVAIASHVAVPGIVNSQIRKTVVVPIATPAIIGTNIHQSRVAQIPPSDQIVVEYAPSVIHIPAVEMREQVLVGGLPPASLVEVNNYHDFSRIIATPAAESGYFGTREPRPRSVLQQQQQAQVIQANPRSRPHTVSVLSEVQPSVSDKKPSTVTQNIKATTPQNPLSVKDSEAAGFKVIKPSVNNNVGLKTKTSSSAAGSLQRKIQSPIKINIKELGARTQKIDQPFQFHQRINNHNIKNSREGTKLKRAISQEAVSRFKEIPHHKQMKKVHQSRNEQQQKQQKQPIYQYKQTQPPMPPMPPKPLTSQFEQRKQSQPPLPLKSTTSNIEDKRQEQGLTMVRSQSSKSILVPVPEAEEKKQSAPTSNKISSSQQSNVGEVKPNDQIKTFVVKGNIKAREVTTILPGNQFERPIQMIKPAQTGILKQVKFNDDHSINHGINTFWHNKSVSVAAPSPTPSPKLTPVAMPIEQPGTQQTIINMGSVNPSSADISNRDQPIQPIQPTVESTLQQNTVNNSLTHPPNTLQAPTSSDHPPETMKKIQPTEISNIISQQATELQMIGHSSFQQPWKVTNNLPLPPPKPVVQATLSTQCEQPKLIKNKEYQATLPQQITTVQQALDMLSVPMIQVLEYMPEKGVQFPQSASPTKLEGKRQSNQQSQNKKQVDRNAGYSTDTQQQYKRHQSQTKEQHPFDYPRIGTIKQPQVNEESASQQNHQGQGDPQDIEYHRQHKQSKTYTSIYNNNNNIDPAKMNFNNNNNNTLDPAKMNFVHLDPAKIKRPYNNSSSKQVVDVHIQIHQQQQNNLQSDQDIVYQTAEEHIHTQQDIHKGQRKVSLQLHNMFKQSTQTQANQNQNQNQQDYVPNARKGKKKNSVLEAGLKVIYDQQGGISSVTKQHGPYLNEMRDVVSRQTEETRDPVVEQQSNQPRSGVNSTNNLPSTVIVNGEVYPYPKKIVSKYETIIDETTTYTKIEEYANRYVQRTQQRHNTTIDKWSENMNDQEKHTATIEKHSNYNTQTTTNPILIFDRQCQTPDNLNSSSIETQTNIKNEQKIDLDYLRRKYESSSTDIHIDRYDKSNYRDIGYTSKYQDQNYNSITSDVDKLLRKYQSEKNRVYSKPTNYYTPVTAYDSYSKNSVTQYRPEIQEQSVIVFTGYSRVTTKGSRAKTNLSSKDVSYADLRERLRSYQQSSIKGNWGV